MQGKTSVFVACVRHLVCFTFRRMRARTEPRSLSLLEIRLVGILVLAGLLGAPWPGPNPAAPRPETFTSHAALQMATSLQTLVESLDYDDPRLAATAGFATPDESLTAETSVKPGYLASWKIVDDLPARRMKTIEVRVRWPGTDGRHELSVISIRAS